MSRSCHWFAGLVAIPLVLLSSGAWGDDQKETLQLLDRLKAAGVAIPAVPSPPDFSTPPSASLTTSPPKPSPDETAPQWLAGYDHSITNPPAGNSSGSFDSDTTPPLLASLPGPASWPALQKLVEARALGAGAAFRTGFPLRVLVHTLNNEEDQQWADLAALTPATTTAPPILNSTTASLLLGCALSNVTDRPDAVEKFWSEAFQRLGKFPAFSASPDSETLELPDFVTILDPARAEPLLIQAFTLFPFPWTKVRGEATRRLARKVALAHVDQLKLPVWYLTESLDASDLYAALSRKFPATIGSDPAATSYHVLTLVIHDKIPEALDAAASLDENSLNDAIQAAVTAGWGEQIYSFLTARLRAHADGNWDEYVQLAAQTDHGQEALELIQKVLADKKLSPDTHRKVGEVLYRALLAVDKVDEGIAELRKLIAQPAPPQQPDNSSFSPPDWNDKIIDWDLQLAELGRLLKRPALEKESLNQARSIATDNGLIDYFIETGRYAEAEKRLIDAIVQQATQNKDNTDSFNFSNQDNLVKLALVYYDTERWTDLLALLEKAPGWGADDLVSIADKETDLDHIPTPCLGLMAARALAETGHVDQARPVLDYVLQIKSGSDAAYALLLKIGQGDLVARLDALYHQDQFEERPLIWRATVLLQRGKIDEAEQACKAAIAVDPSDGDEGKGDRMRVYSVMAQVCDAKHDTKQAVFFRNVVKAIRLSEDADDFQSAGLVTRAVAMYAQALDLFSDAYCIQSRIARHLAELGRMEEAAIHYRRAFELMPVSFGRMESHCFGCERAFEGKTAVAIAQQTFSEMLKKDPKKPQLYYLLGYLEKEQEDYPAAAAHFQKAAELDSDYINAWKQLMEIGDNYQLQPAVRDQAVFNVLRLDPQGRHTSPDTKEVRDLAKLWSVLETCAQAVPPVPSSLLVLQASVAQRKADIARIKTNSPPGFDDIQKQLQALQYQLVQARHSPAPLEATTINAVLTTAFRFFP